MMISANTALTGSYDYSEVAGSILIAIAASYAALDLTGRVTVARGRVRLAWLSGGAMAMGIGIWAMHFKGMLAFRLPVPVEYHWPTVLASLLVAILASAVALYVASRQKMGPVEALTGGVIMACGIAGMHYIGMAAMRLPAITHFSALLVTCSILLAILFSLIALLLAFDLREETKWTVPRRLGSAAVMGAAVSAMHYTGMAAASFMPASGPDLSHAVNISPLANSGIAIVTLIVIVAAVATSSVDRRTGVEALRLNQELERRVAERTLQLEAVNHELRKQKEVFQKIFENIPVMIVLLDQGGRHELVNPEWERTIGWTLKEIREPNLDIFAEAFPDLQYRQMVKGDIAASSNEWADLKVRVRGGRVIDVAATFVHLSDGSSLFIGKDITEWKRTQAELRESEARFRLVADSAPVMIWMSGTDKLCTYFNKPWLDFTGRPIERELGNGWAEGIHPEDLRKCMTTYIQAFDRREEFTMEYRLRRHDGEYRWVSDIGVPRFNPDGSFAGYIGSCIDVTDPRRAEEQLRQVQEDLARVTRVVAMGELAAAIAHEVNQPLTAIVTNGNFSLRQLESGTPNPDELRAAIREIVNDGARASAVISRIRGLLMKGALKRTELDINQIIQEVIILLRNELIRNRVHLRTELAANLPLVQGDPVQLQQVLINLITNAVEAMRLSTEQPRELLIRSAKNPDGVLVQVQDSGPGIGSALSDRIFEPFFTTKTEGIGMGLSISRSIIESHGGKLSIMPASQGALFQFTLPVNSNNAS